MANERYEFQPRFVNKKEAFEGDDKEVLDLLKERMYSRPLHWRNPVPRAFVGWDGEGITYPGDVQQSYVLFGASTGDRIAKPRLDTADCLDLLLGVERQNRDAVHCGFAVQYDCNMILKDLPMRHLWRLYRHGVVRWEGYRIEYRPGKWLAVKREDTFIRLFDVWGFFQSSFVAACERFLGEDDPELDRIREGKAARTSFTYDQLDTFIIPYWEGELRLLVRLMDSLRDDLTEAGIKLASWHGPGAVANSVFRRHGLQNAKGEVPKEVNRAAQYAYAGGRFELFQCGHHAGPVWQYDINSAYPTAIADLPNLSRGRWDRVKRFEPGSFGVWHIQYDSPGSPARLFSDPQPLFHRDRHGNVSFPPLVEGWYWTPEAELVDPRCIQQGWVYRQAEDEKNPYPFKFVNEMYETRRLWKSQGKSAEKALKLALNSLYGKMAQRTGWKEGEPIPRWHQLEWAGFVTSATRASLFRAISLRSGASTVLACETDAIFSTQPLPMDLGPGLGQWEETRYEWITYLQSGFYYAGTAEGSVVEKYRGFDRGSVPYEAVQDYLQGLDNGRFPTLEGITTRFVGMGLGMFTQAVWRSWQQQPRAVHLGGGGKRAHVRALCSGCKEGRPLASTLHPLTIVTPGGRSEPHDLPWLAGAESELRRLDALAMW